MKIYIYENMIEFFPSVKTLNAKYLENSGSVETKRAIVDRPYGLSLQPWLLQYNFRTPTYQLI